MSLRRSEVFRKPRKRSRKVEKDVQRACLRWLAEHDIPAAVTDAGAAYKAGRYSGWAPPAGWPDITCVLPGGRFLGVECKAPKGRQSKKQKAMQERIERLGGLYVLAKGVDDLKRQIGDEAT